MVRDVNSNEYVRLYDMGRTPPQVSIWHQKYNPKSVRLLDDDEDDDSLLNPIVYPIPRGVIMHLNLLINSSLKYFVIGQEGLNQNGHVVLPNQLEVFQNIPIALPVRFVQPHNLFPTIPGVLYPSIH